MPSEADPSWLTHMDSALPSPSELIPLTHSLITPHLALLFNIPTTTTTTTTTPPPPTTPHSPTLKRPRLVWTPQLHKRFVDAVAQLGIKTAVPKTIMHLMSVDGLTRENVASHLQKYRLYLKRIKNSSATAGGGISAADHHLFSTAAAPQQYVSYPQAAVLQQQQQQQMQQIHQMQQMQYYHQMAAAQAQQRFMARPQQVVGVGQAEMNGGGGRRELSLFPAADN